MVLQFSGAPRQNIQLLSVAGEVQRRGVHTLRAERGMGGQNFGRREKVDCPLTVKYVLCDLTPRLTRVYTVQYVQ
jgi:hypothetical protein